MIGAHLPVSGGREKVFGTAAALGCECVQIFVKNQRQWRVGPLAAADAAAYRTAQKQAGLPVVAHAGYLINLASPDRAARGKSEDSLTDELGRCETLGIPSLVVHPGSPTDGKAGEGISRIAAALDEVHRRCPGYAVRILLETTAGQGNALGHRFDQLSAIISAVSDGSRIGVCLDTCHMFAAGYAFGTRAEYEAVMSEVDAAVGLIKVACIHMNDSKRELGSRVDRHEHIGKGMIGEDGFRHFLNDPRFAGVPMILETEAGGREADIRLLRSLRKG